MKKTISLLLALMLVCGCMVLPASATPGNFNDVAADAYYHDAVEWAIQSGITAGVGNNNFGSNNPCTRGQVMTMLWRAAGSPDHASAASPFSDVTPDDYYYHAVLWAVENGITAGVGNNRFGSGNPCTRAQIVTFLWKSSGSPEPANASGQFSDVPSDAYYAKPVAWAVENGVTSGVGNNQFGSSQTCIRAQIVTFLWKEDQITPPVAPEPTEPKPTEPKPTEPKPTTPKPTEPKPTTPKPTEPPHTHKYVSKTVAPTCTNSGYTVHTCSCGDSYIDSYVDPIPHTPKVSIQEPTCTIPGSRDTVCAVCGMEMHSELISPTGHHMEMTSRVESTCGTDGYEEFTCKKCGYQEKTPLPRPKHEYRWETTKDATDTSEGEQSCVCQKCGEVFQTAPLPRYSQNTQDYEIDMGGGETKTVRGFYQPEYEQRVFEMLNAYRVENGVDPLMQLPSIVNAAAIRGAEQAVSYTHTRPNGLPFTSVLGYARAENLAMGNPTPESVMEAWKKSPGHNENMLRPQFSKVGISCFFEEEVDYDGNIHYMPHWVQLFG